MYAAPIFLLSSPENVFLTFRKDFHLSLTSHHAALEPSKHPFSKLFQACHTRLLHAIASRPCFLIEKRCRFGCRIEDLEEQGKRWRCNTRERRRETFKVYERPWSSSSSLFDLPEKDLEIRKNVNQGVREERENFQSGKSEERR